MKSKTTGELEKKVEGIMRDMELLELTKESVFQGLDEMLRNYYGGGIIPNKERLFNPEESEEEMMRGLFGSLNKFQGDIAKREGEWQKNAAKFLDSFIKEELEIKEEDIQIIKDQHHEIYKKLKSIEEVISPLKKFGLSFFMTAKNRYYDLALFLNRYKENEVTKLSKSYNESIHGLYMALSISVVMGEGGMLIDKLSQNIPSDAMQYMGIDKENINFLRDMMLGQFGEKSQAEAKNKVVENLISIDSIYKGIIKNYSSLRAYFEEIMHQTE